MKTKKKKVYTVTLCPLKIEPELEEKLNLEAERSKDKMSDIRRKALRRYLN